MSRSLTGKVILSILFLWMLDTCLLPFLGFFRPVLTYLWILYIAFHWPSQGVWASTLFVGILRDLTGSLPLGVETVSLVILLSALVFFLQKFQRDSPVLQWGIGAIFIFLAMFFNLTLTGLLSAQNPWSWAAALSLISVPLSSAVILPIYFYLARRIFREEAQSLKKQYELFG